MSKLSIEAFKLLKGDCQLQTVLALQRRGDKARVDRLVEEVSPRILMRTAVSVSEGIVYYLNPNYSLLTNEINAYSECSECGEEYLESDGHECQDSYSCSECGNEYNTEEEIDSHYAARHN